MNDLSNTDFSRLKAGAKLLPVGLRRTDAAAFVGISTSTFDFMVNEGTMPKPRTLGRNCKVWSVSDLMQAFEDLPYDQPATNTDDDEGNDWDVAEEEI